MAECVALNPAGMLAMPNLAGGVDLNPTTFAVTNLPLVISHGSLTPPVAFPPCGCVFAITALAKRTPRLSLCVRIWVLCRLMFSYIN